MSKTYSKTKEELKLLLSGLIKENGSELKIRLSKLDQGNQYRMYNGKIRIDATYAIIRRIPRDYDNPDGIQRALKESKVADIEKSSTDDPQRFSSPNAIVIALESTKDYVEFLPDPSDKSTMYYIVDLEKLHTVISNSETDEDGYIKDESSIFVGTLLDGHHRSSGLYEAGKLNFECPITVYIDLPKEDMAKVFAEINQHQEKPSTVHTLAMKAMAGTLSSLEELAHNITVLLNSERWSILNNRIKDIDGKRPKNLPKPYVTNSTFEKLLQQQVLHHFPKDLSIPRKARLLNDYFTAWSEVFTDAWNDEKNHVLVKSMGFQIMIRIFSVIFSRAATNGTTPTKDDYVKFIKAYLKEKNTISLDGVQLQLDWSSKNFGSYSSGKGINAISNSLTQHIANEYYIALQQSNRQ